MDFRLTIQTEFTKWPLLLNSDQMGFSKEMNSSRTLSHTNEKVTFLAVRSTNNVSHSYTVQPIISYDRGLMDNVFLCLYEPKGRFGERVKESMFKTSNVIVSCRTSGKLSNSHIMFWVENCLKPIVKDEHFMLILDSWAGHKDNSLYQTFGSKIALHIIPTRTTATTQPLDVFFNYWWKYVARRLTNYVIVEDIKID